VVADHSPRIPSSGDSDFFNKHAVLQQQSAHRPGASGSGIIGAPQGHLELIHTGGQA
jgi:hypothetical protein